MPWLLHTGYNGLRMLKGNPALQRCPDCSMALNKWDIPVDLATRPAGGPQWSSSVDGFHVVSPSFVRRYESEGFFGLEFRGLSCGYFDARPRRWVRVLTSEVPWGDVIPGHPSGLPVLLTNHSSKCPTCNQFRRIRASIGTVIAPEEPAIAPCEFVGVNHFAGDNDLQRFNLIVGDEVRTAHRSRKLKGASIFHRALHAGRDCPVP